MGCNAANHGWSCNCGFGGDTGGRGGRRFPILPAASPLRAPGYGARWGYSSRSGPYESFTRPNAKCPVCGATVFFYQSPSGGRVFFDALGAPWQKHPCTDNASPASPYPERVDGRSESDRDGFRAAGWLPVTEANWMQWAGPGSANDFGLLGGRSGRSKSAFNIALPPGTKVDLHSPVFVRPHEERADWCWLDGPGVVGPEGQPAPVLAFAADRRTHHEEEMVEIAVAGRYPSVLCGLAGNRSFGLSEGAYGRDYVLALRWYKAAARLGDWRAFNNLALMFEDGKGTPKDPKRAQIFYRRAACSGDAIAVANLARFRASLTGRS